MSWIEQLSRTYDACFGQDRPGFSTLAAISTVPQTTQLHILLHEDGTFQSAEINELEDTPLFVTEDSASRSGTKPSANPLTEQLEYCAKGLEAYGGKPDKYSRYIELLKAWAKSDYSDPMIVAIQRYVEGGTLLRDLLNARIVSVQGNALATVKIGMKTQDPLKLWVRWSVNGFRRSATWCDPDLTEKWRKFEPLWSREQEQKQQKDVRRRKNTKSGPDSACMISGTPTRTTQKHPKRIRFSADNSKLISANDDSGYTFRGRFSTSDEALTIGYEVSQKAHNALRWLIARQGTRIDDQVIVCWAVQGAEPPPLMADSWEMFQVWDTVAESVVPSPTVESFVGDVGQQFALRLNASIRGYAQQLGDNADVVVMALGSATPGRMAILYYRELKGSEFLCRLENWHASLAWPQRLGKNRTFVGAPSPRDIAEAAYGRRLDDKLRKVAQERLLPCILDVIPLPNDLVVSVVNCAKNRVALNGWEFERNLGIACSLFKAAHPKENYSMSLDEARTTRDYLYGRLLAGADDIESTALWLAGQKRETSASRLMQRFADHPCSTWRTLELQLRPYIAQLRASRPGYIALRLKLIDQIVNSFENRNGENSFLDNHPLSGEFLLGYHSQREALRSRKSKSEGEEPNNNEDNNEGDAL